MRSMMLRIEELNSNQQKITCSSFKDLCADMSIISLHIELLADAGYIDISANISTRLGRDFLIRRLTFSGYDYLDAVRNPSVWEKTKHKLSSIGGSATLDIVKSIAVSFLQAQLGI